MMACNGRVRREGDVIHVVAGHLEDLSDLLRVIGDREEGFSVSYGRGDGAIHASRPHNGEADSGDGLGERLRVRTRDFH